MTTIPRNNRVSCETPIVLDGMQIGMANPTKKDFERDIIRAIFPAKNTNNAVHDQIYMTR